MYICNCHGVRESEISQTIQSGATTLKALRQALGVGTCCGKCVTDVRDQLHREAGTRHGGCKGCGKCSRSDARQSFAEPALAVC